MRRIFFLLILIFFVCLGIYYVTKNNTHLDGRAFIGINKSKDYLVGITTKNEIVTASFTNPEMWEKIDYEVQSGITPKLQTTKNNNYLLYGKGEKSVIYNLETKEKKEIPYSYDSIIIGEITPDLLLFSNDKRNNNLVISRIQEEKQEKILTLPPLQENEEVSVAWGFNNTLWYAIIPTEDDGGGNFIPSEKNTFYQINLSTKKVLQKIPNIASLSPSWFSDEIIITRINSGITKIHKKGNTEETLITEFDTQLQKLLCEFGNETTVKCYGYNFALDQLFSFKLFDKNSGNTIYTQTYDESNVFPTSYVVDPTSKTLYLLNLKEDGKLYKELIPTP